MRIEVESFGEKGFAKPTVIPADEDGVVIVALNDSLGTQVRIDRETYRMSQMGFAGLRDRTPKRIDMTEEGRIEPGTQLAFIAREMGVNVMYILKNLPEEESKATAVPTGSPEPAAV